MRRAGEAPNARTRSGRMTAIDGDARHRMRLWPAVIPGSTEPDGGQSAKRCEGEGNRSASEDVSAAQILWAAL